MATKYKLYRSKMTVEKWYGSAVRIPTIHSAQFPNFVFNCVGLVSSMYTRKFGDITIASSNSVPTAYADKTRHKIVISNKFLKGNFSSLGIDDYLTNKKTVGAILGVLVHEIGHFIHTPMDGLKSHVEYVESQTTKQFNHAMVRDLANIVEDIYIENAISNTFPTLEWSLQEINRLMLTDEKYSQAQKYFSSVTSVDDSNYRNIMNFLLYAKVTRRAGNVSPFVRDIFNLARSVVDTTTLEQRHDIVLRLYEILAIDKIDMPEIDIDDDTDNDDDDDATDDDDRATTDDVDDVKSSIADDDTEMESDDDTDDTDDTDDNESDDDLESDDDDDDDDDDESDDDSTDDMPDDDDDLDYDFDLDVQPIADDDLDLEIPEHDQQEMKASAISWLGNGLMLREIKPDLDDPIDLDPRYIRLVEIARQRANVSKPLGTPRNSGNSLRDLSRIIVDGKIFAERAPSTNFQPMDVMIVIDCSGSMRGYKFSSAIRQALGCATALLAARCTVQVFGHTADARYKGDVGIFEFLRRGESASILAQRLGWLEHRSHYHLAANRDGYALECLAKRMPKQSRQRMMIVISDGQPSAGNPNYDGSYALDHTRMVVDDIRKSGIKVQSLSIDSSAYIANNYIYGESHNVCSTDTDALDKLIRQVLMG